MIIRIDPAIGIPPAPDVVSMRQARLALLQAGLLAMVEGAIDGLESPSREAARIEWEYAQEVHRDSPLTRILASGLSLTTGQLDQLFRAAAEL